MDDFRRINEPRVEKIVHSMKTILKSAKSNKATVDDVRDLFAPVSTRLAKLGSARAVTVPDEDIARIREAGPGPAIPQPQPRLDLRAHSTRATLEAMDVKQLVDLLTMTAAQIDLKLNE
jgi:hypothetical protein